MTRSHDEAEAEDVRRQYEEACARAMRARGLERFNRALNEFATGYRKLNWSFWSQWRGLIRIVPVETLKYGHVPLRSVRVPFGWKATKCWHRNAMLLMPWWLWIVYYPYAWHQTLTFEPLIRLGFWRLTREDDWYIDGHVTLPRWVRRFWWCFINDRDSAPTRYIAFADLVRDASLLLDVDHIVILPSGEVCHEARQG